ncbi:uncharacterized protein LOC125241773 [Leguminivora glycinivorella]|uniref:uncharacterized protein LOC125241773 n=1 Tax=Leguminivora glycinivorella TaxID=1035111 RepID=UPI00200DB8ED|nr:uncharacterized protein LOC125241773 [Leguminivora glycinivorella]
MGCGQSKINLYPRRNKNSSKNSKKSGGTAETNESEEEEGCPEATEETETEEQPDPRQHVLPISEHQPPFEVSASQQNFFKMLDEKIEQGKDYDSSSETEIQEEEERKRRLIEHWCSFSQSSVCTPSPPTPAARRRMTRSVSRASERQCGPAAAPHAQAYQESPPARRAHSGQPHESRPSTSAEWEHNKSPMKRTQSAGPCWRGAPKVAPMPKPKGDKRDEPVAGCSKDSQITYNPTFQNHSPAHSAKGQPYIAQLVSYPMAAPASPTKFIAPPEEYQDPDVSSVDRQITVTQVNSQTQIYYIHGNAAATGAPPDIVQQRQQTAIHLQQYVAMKQAQQQMFSSYMQRSPHAVFPGEGYPPNAPRMYEGEELAAQYGYPGPRPQSAPHRGHVDVAHTHTPVWNPLPPVMSTQWAGGVVPPEMQYYPQSQFVPMFRATSAGSAGTLTRYHKKEDPEKAVQSINVVRGKPVGQIVAVSGQELAVSSAVSDSPSPASVSTDSGVSPGTSAPSSKSSFGSTPPTACANDTFEPHHKPKKNKSTVNRSLKVSKSLDA